MKDTKSSSVSAKSVTESYRLARDSIERSLDLLRIADKHCGILLEDDFITTIDGSGDDDSGVDESIVMYDDVFEILSDLLIYCSEQFIESLRVAIKTEDSSENKRKLQTAIQRHRRILKIEGYGEPNTEINTKSTKLLFLQNRGEA